jgi:hypothetical protein
MKHKLTLLLFLALATSVSAVAQNQPAHSISLRLGVPLGLTYKTYVTRRAALEFGLGAASPYWAKQYYINSFNSFSRYENYKYLDHRVSSTLYLQARYLKDFSIPTTGMEGQLGWYCGAGVVAKIAQISYTYTNTDAIPPTQKDSRTDIDFGPEAILGAEYWLEDTPFSFYGEGSAMLEVFDRVTVRPFIAIGARFHFIE